MKKELKPCPFCGGEAKIDSWNSTDGYMNDWWKRVQCTVCDIAKLGKTEEEVIEAWNTRKLPENAPIKPSGLKYAPTCPRGYTDCVCDPAYIKFNHPDWYKNLYGDKTPEEAASGCRERVREDPNEEYYCYDNEDK